ncbi:unnamed protein product [Camellia sinensis]
MNALLKTSLAFMQMTSAFFKTKSIKLKHSFLSLEQHAGQLPGLGRGPTPPCRGVASMAIFKSEVGKNLGFPLDNMKNRSMKNLKNMNMGKMNAKIETCYYNS